ncbi:MAG: hypothetical protein KAY40_03170, partial [Alistipes sp.]|nr:hypothetical protein [Alistipes sp.]
ADSARTLRRTDSSTRSILSKRHLSGAKPPPPPDASSADNGTLPEAPPQPSSGKKRLRKTKRMINMSEKIVIFAYHIHST